MIVEGLFIVIIISIINQHTHSHPDYQHSHWHPRQSQNPPHHCEHHSVIVLKVAQASLCCIGGDARGFGEEQDEQRGAEEEG